MLLVQRSTRVKFQTKLLSLLRPLVAKTGLIDGRGSCSVKVDLIVPQILERPNPEWSSRKSTHFLPFEAALRLSAFSHSFTLATAGD
jgi:hypothetical protein